MTRSSASYVTNATASDATSYRAFGSPISTAIATALPRTSATGQVVWASVAAPTTTTTRDYEVYAFTDSLQATKPVFIRINYWGNANAASNYSGLSVSVGTTSDATGTLGGLTTGLLTVINYSAAPGGATKWVYASSDGSQLVVMMQLYPPGTTPPGGTYETPGGFIVERTRDADGTPNGNGFTVMNWASNADQQALGAASTFQQVRVRSFDGLINTTSYDPGAFYPYGQTHSTRATYSGNSTTVAPCFTYTDSTQLFGPSRALALINSSDSVPRLTPVPVTIGTTSVQMVALTGNLMYVSYVASNPGATANVFMMAPMIRFE